MKVLDILITSASRPDLLQHTVESMQEKLKFSGEFRWLLHEDVLDKKKSAEVLHWNKYSLLFDKVIVSEPRVSLGYSIGMMIPYIKSFIFFRSDDDWEYVEKLDLDVFWDMFEKYEKINQIIFNKRCIDEYKRNFKRKSIKFNDIWLTVTRQWGWLPSLWRTDFVRRNYKIRAIDCSIDFMDRIRHREDVNADWIIENMGSYFLGKIGDKGAYIKHIGGYNRTCDKGGRLGI